MRWLVTGGCGFVGRNFIKLLLSRTNDTIRVVDDLSVGTLAELEAINPVMALDPGTLAPAAAERAAARIELIAGDVRDAALAGRVVAGADAVVHLAANTGVGPSVADPMRDCTINVLGTVNYLEACRQRGVSRFVFASSGAPIGDCEPPIHEELPTHPVSPYGASKLAGEAYCSAYTRSFGIETVALRFGNCYGPLSSHKGSIVAKFIREALAAEPWEIYGDGSQTRDFIFVEDIAEAIFSGATTPGIAGEVFQIATNAETTVLELADSLRAVLMRHEVAAPVIRHAAPRVGDVKRNYSDTSKARRRLRWQPHVGLEDGLDRTVEWFLRGGFAGAA
jgi:UDP-glucose 4-epimerase